MSSELRENTSGGTEQTANADSEQKIPGYWAKNDLSTAEKIRAFEGTPLSERGLPSNVYDYIRAGAEIDPEAPALIYLPEAGDLDTIVEFTHAEFLQRVTQSARLFASLNTEHRAPVSLINSNAPELSFALWGAQSVGVANPLNWMLEPDLLGEMITAAGSKILVIYGGDSDIDLWGKLPKILAAAPRVEVVIRAGGDRSGAIPTGVDFLEFEDELARFDGSVPLDTSGTVGTDVAAIFSTGGTTGSPKLAKITHLGQIYASWASAIMHQVPIGTRRFCASPAFHVHGIAITQLTAVAAGGTMILPTASGWRGKGVVENFWDIVCQFEVDNVPMLPTIANRIVRHPEDVPESHPLKVVTSGSAPLSASTAEKFEDLTGITVAEGYGLTETSGAVVSNPHGVSTIPGRVGMPNPYTGARIVRRDESGDLIDCAIGEVGVLLLHGPSIFAGYVDARQNEGVLLPDGWLETGDVAILDEDGFIRITGRSKDLIIRGGHNIDPAAVEEILFRHSKVVEGSVVGMPDADAGEIPIAYIVVTDASVATLDDIEAHVRAMARERASVPKKFFVVNELPKSPVGKILKSRLREDALQRGFEERLKVAGITDYEVDVRNTGPGASTVCVLLPARDPAEEAAVRDALSTMSVSFELEYSGS